MNETFAMNNTSAYESNLHLHNALPVLNVHALLKEGTRALHSQLDHHPLVKPLLNIEATPHDMALSLSGFLHAYSALDGAGIPQRWRLLNVGYQERFFCDWLRADIRMLCGNRNILMQMDTSAELLNLKSEAELFGSLYVILGSAMGAVRIANILAQSPHFSIREVGFFKQLALSSTCFRVLMTQLQYRITTASEANEVLQGAVNTFNLFIQSFDSVFDESSASSNVAAYSLLNAPMPTIK